MIKIGNYKFEFIEKGIGEPIVFVHGSVSDYRTWNRQMEEFGQFYRSITYSRRYHWPNVKISAGEDYSMDQHVTDLGEILETLKRPVHLVGHSYGAFVALLLAMRSPELIRSLVLAEPPLVTLFISDKPKLSEIIKLFISKPRTALALISFAVKGKIPAAKAVQKDQIEKALELFGKATLGVDAFLNVSEERKKQVMDNFIRAEFLGSGFPPLDDNKIREVRIPTLLLSGQHSPTIFSLFLDRLEELLPVSERTVIANASHIMHEDNAHDFNRVVRSFIERQSS